MTVSAKALPTSAARPIVRGAAAVRAGTFVRRHAPRIGSRSALVIAGFLRSEVQGANRTASSLFRYRLQLGAKRQVQPRGLARYTDDRLGGEAAFGYRKAR